MGKQKFFRGDLVLIESKWHPLNNKKGIYCSPGINGYGAWILMFPAGSVYIPFANMLKKTPSVKKEH
jgi:hypothetical protein